LEYPESPANDSVDAQNQDPDLTNALMCFCMLVVMQDTSRIRLYESPMMHYFAVRGAGEIFEQIELEFNHDEFEHSILSPPPKQSPGSVPQISLR
jgi:hypothetical protein